MSSRGRTGRAFRSVSGALLAGGLVAALLTSSMTVAAAAPRHRATAAVAGSLFGIACPSSSSCVAVGQRSATSKGPGGTLAEHWNGSKWSSVTSPNPAGSDGTRLDGVACASTKNCLAVGDYSNSAHTATLPTAEKWNGSKWSVVTVPAPSGATSAALAAISCTSATNCQAAGESGDATLTEKWNGSKWSIEPSPNPNASKPNVLTGVACAASTECWAVGYYFPTSMSGSLTERWNGSKWSVTTTPSSKSGQLIGDSCASKSDCVSVGIGNSLFAIGQHWTGSKWATATPKKPSGATDSELLGVSCPGNGSACVAGGNTMLSSGSTTLAEGWTGSKWAIQQTPSISGSTYADFGSVACTKASNCWATGETISSTGVTDPLIERWNGKSWSVAVS